VGATKGKRGVRKDLGPGLGGWEATRGGGVLRPKRVGVSWGKEIGGSRRIALQKLWFGDTDLCKPVKKVPQTVGVGGKERKEKEGRGTGGYRWKPGFWAGLEKKRVIGTRTVVGGNGKVAGKKKKHGRKE